MLDSGRVLEEEGRLSRGAEQTHLWPVIGQRTTEGQVSQGTPVSKESVGFTSWTVLSPGSGGGAHRHLTLNQIFNEALTRG